MTRECAAAVAFKLAIERRDSDLLMAVLNLKGIGSSPLFSTQFAVLTEFWSKAKAKGKINSLNLSLTKH